MTVDQAAFGEFQHSLEQLAANAPTDTLDDNERLARARNTFMTKIDRRTAVDLETCIHCGMCSEACHFYMATGDERYTPAWKIDPLRRFYRREISPLRFLYRLFTRKIDIDDLREWQELVYEACTGCGRCDMMCPMGINISSSINVMREGLAAAGLAPAELAALQSEQRDKDTLFGVGVDELTALVGELSSNGGAIPLDKESADVLLLTTAVEVRLFPEAIRSSAKILQKAGADWTLSTTAFEAANLGLISGDKHARRTALSRIIQQAKACGVSAIVVPESGHAYQALRWESANELDEELPFEVLAISEYIARQIDAGALELKLPSDIVSVTYHDPCRLGRQSGVFEEPRRVLQAMGLEIRETASNRRENLCCGGGCGEYTISHSAPIRQKAFDLKRHELDDTRADAVVTSCNNCRVNLMIGAKNSGWDKTVISLAETVASNLAD
jgi:Fe-S oxidoreductase